MKRILISTLFVIFTLFAGESFADVACTTNASGEVTNTGSANCYVQPQDYRMTIYKIGLCTVAPSATTTTAIDYSKCAIVYNSASGAETSIVKGQFTQLPGGFTKPPPGNYTSAFIEMGPSFSIRGNNSFAINFTGSAGGTGKYCWSDGGTVYGYQDGSIPVNAVTCGTSAGRSSATTFISNGFGGAATFIYTGSSGGVTVNAYLVKNDYKLPSSGTASNTNGVYRMVGVANTNTQVKDDIKNMNVAFDVTNGATISLYMSGGVQKLYAYTTGPFTPIFTVR